MEYLQFTEFRNRSKEYFEKIEEGESFVIVRKGRPVARIIPFVARSGGWKRALERVKLRRPSKTTTEILSEERSER